MVNDRDNHASTSTPLWWSTFTRRRYTAGASTYKARLRRYLRAFAYVFNIHTLVMLALALLSVYICTICDLRWNMDFSLVATGTVFPLTFAISSAFARRERATVLIANLKASVIALYFMHRDWDQSDNFPSSLGNDRSPWALKSKVLLVELMVSLRKFLTLRSEMYESVAERRLTVLKHDLLGLFEHEMLLSDTEKDHAFAKALHRLQRHDPAAAHLKDCYRALSMLSVMNEQLTMKSGYTRGGEGGLSRTNQYLRYVISNIEELRMIKEYRTPAMMRHACALLFHIFAIILAPYFVHFCDTWVAQGYEEDTCIAGYMGSTFYVLIVMLLLHCDQDLEDCFDETGLDDVFFTVHEEVDVMDGQRDARVLLTTQSSGEMSRGDMSRSQVLHRGGSLAGGSPPPGATLNGGPPSPAPLRGGSPPPGPLDDPPPFLLHPGLKTTRSEATLRGPPFLRPAAVDGGGLMQGGPSGSSPPSSYTKLASRSSLDAMYRAHSADHDLATIPESATPEATPPESCSSTSVLPAQQPRRSSTGQTDR